MGEDQLAAAYAKQMYSRLYRPAGMAGARLADDPRGLVTNYARGNARDLTGTFTTLPYASVGSYAPIGGALTTLNDMAAYVRLQLRAGVSVSGRRVVSAGNLAECWKPHISVPVDHPNLDPDAASSGYGMGWYLTRYRDGTSLIWHDGGIDGFTSWIGFLPEHDIGLVVLNSMSGNRFLPRKRHFRLGAECSSRDGAPGSAARGGRGHSPGRLGHPRLMHG